MTVKADERTDDTLPDHTCVLYRLELEAVLESSHTMRTRRGADRDYQLVISVST